MRAKRTTVALVAGGRREVFEYSHAERILRMRKNGGWRLPEDSKFEFDGHVLQRRTVKKGDC